MKPAMKKRLYLPLFSLALFAAGASTIYAEQDVITRSLPVKPGGTLVMKVDRGTVHVASSDSDKVDVKVVRELKRASAGKAKEIFEQHKIEITGSDNQVTIEAENPQRKLTTGFSNPFNNLQVDYTISVPSRFNLDIRTAGGSIDVADLEGKVAVRTSGGDVKLGAIKGPVQAHTSGGSILLHKGEGEASLHTSGGDVHVVSLSGDLVARTSGGSITVDAIKGSVKADTSGGDVRIKDASGTINARTSGGSVTAQLNGQPKEPCSLRTSGGNVEVHLADKLALDLNARTSGGSVHSDFPGNQNKQKTTLTAQLNGGGPNLVMETSGGNVNIHRK